LTRKVSRQSRRRDHAETIDENMCAAMKERRLVTTAMGKRVEVRRLLAWFQRQIFREASIGHARHLSRL